MKYICLFVATIMLILFLIGCEGSSRPDKVVNVRINLAGGRSDTIKVEYYKNLYLLDQKLKDENMSIKAYNVESFSIIGDIKEMK